ncbi:MAG: hypothetical protein J7L82_05045 [Staphylothermus sp.]|nr:hypothetical protein [Staphylothermus sp.]
MMEDEELRKLLEKVASKIIKQGSREMKKEVDEKTEGIEVDMVGIDSPHGIYVYEPSKDKWVLVRTKGDYFKPDRDGFYIVYFDNTRCPACRIYDLAWYPYIKLIGSSLENTYFVIILCDWFARECKSEAAKKSFEHYDVHASPTTLLMYVENGEIKDMERIEGSKTLDKLAEIIDNFIKKHKKSE